MERPGAKNTNLGKMWKGEQNKKDWQLFIVLPWLNVTLNGLRNWETRLENVKFDRAKSLAKARDVQSWVPYNEAIRYALDFFIFIFPLCETTWC